ncbi:MAG: hypothetical protein AAGM04_02235 [Pseudomonadota bacterium]
MTMMTNIRLALRLDELNCAVLRKEGHVRVIDTRGENGCAQPAQEAHVKRFANWRIDYLQVPVNFSTSDHAAKARLEAALNESGGTAVVVTNEVFAAQGYFMSDAIAQNAVEGVRRDDDGTNRQPALADLYTETSHPAISG